MKIECAPLKREEADAVPALIAEGLDERVFEKTIFSCRGYSEYVKNILKVPELHRRVQFFGAYVRGQLVAFAEWRIFPDCIFLNNIYVSEAWRGKGIGEALLSEQMPTLLKQFRKHKVRLDVFSFNTKAIAWYKRIGFQAESCTHWFLFEPVQRVSDEPPHFIVEDYPLAEASHRLYHFSSFRIIVNNETYQVGRIGERYYRLTGRIRSTERSELWDSLYELDRNRSILLVTDIDEQHAHKVCSSIRMFLDVKKI